MLRVKIGPFPFRKHVILLLNFQKKRAIFKMEICNDNYGRTKINDINGEMRKTQNIKKGIIEKKTYIDC